MAHRRGRKFRLIYDALNGLGSAPSKRQQQCRRAARAMPSAGWPIDEGRKT